jgi:hypothetical protein
MCAGLVGVARSVAGATSWADCPGSYCPFKRASQRCTQLRVNYGVQVALYILSNPHTSCMTNGVTQLYFCVHVHDLGKVAQV